MACVKARRSGLPAGEYGRRDQHVDLLGQPQSIQFEALLVLIAVREHSNPQPCLPSPPKRWHGVIESHPASLVPLKVPGEYFIGLIVVNVDSEKVAHSLSTHLSKSQLAPGIPRILRFRHPRPPADYLRIGDALFPSPADDGASDCRCLIDQRVIEVEEDGAEHCPIFPPFSSHA